MCGFQSDADGFGCFRAWESNGTSEPTGLIRRRVKETEDSHEVAGLLKQHDVWKFVHQRGSLLVVNASEGLRPLGDVLEPIPDVVTKSPANTL